MGSQGVTEAGMHRLGRRYAVLVRTAVLACASAVAVVEAPAGHRLVALALAVGLAAWSVLFLRRGPRGWLVAVDTALVAALCLTQRWTVPADALVDSTNWVLAVVSITAIAHQWYTGTLAAVALTTTVVAAHLVGTAVAAPADWVAALPVALWTFAEAGLSRGLFLLLRAGARNADRAVAESELARRTAAVAAAERADEREHLSVLHDTAASTLFAVGTGMVDGSEPWLRAQAGRDLRAITGRRAATGNHPGNDTGTDTGTTEEHAGGTDLVAVLAPVLRDGPVTVDRRLPDTVPLPAGVARAIAGAVREALVNVGRHAGVDTASVVVEHTAGRVTVEVGDQGRGFDPAAVPGHRRGLTGSVVRRMARVGGRAVVASRPGAGTTVHLEWPA